LEKEHAAGGGKRSAPRLRRRPGSKGGVVTWSELKTSGGEAWQ